MPQLGTMSLHHAQTHTVIILPYGSGRVQTLVYIKLCCIPCQAQRRQQLVCRFASTSLRPHVTNSNGVHLRHKDDNVKIAWQSFVLRQQTPWAHDLLVAVLSSVSVMCGKFMMSMQVHYLGNEGRGTVWEEIIINCPAHIQLLSMSATVANPDDLGFWITKVGCTFLRAHASTCCCNNNNDLVTVFTFSGS